jgi:Protein of unknown function (DUF2934)
VCIEAKLVGMQIKVSVATDGKYFHVVIVSRGLHPAGPRFVAHADNRGGAMIEHNEPSREDIAHRAYELYVGRGSEPGKDVEDWVRAEKELTVEVVVAPAKTIAYLASRN